MHDVLAGKDFFREYSMITETTKDPVREAVQLTWDEFVEDKITSRRARLLRSLIRHTDKSKTSWPKA
jgi:hypothetical protein